MSPGFRFCQKSILVTSLAVFWSLPFLTVSQRAYGGSSDDDTKDVLKSPYLDYGDFNDDQEEEQDERFFQYGRFFGVGLGVGTTQATGNAGQLYGGGFPTLDLRLDYWFDFLLALQLDVKNSSHKYDVAPDGPTSTNLFRTLIQVKYYFDTKDWSAPLAFVSPHLIVGGGFYRRTDNFTAQKVSESANTFGLNAGAGLELTLKPRKFYLQLESTVSLLSFSDSYDPKYQQANPQGGIPNRSGLWIDAVAALMWTW